MPLPSCFPFFAGSSFGCFERKRKDPPDGYRRAGLF